MKKEFLELRVRFVLTVLIMASIYVLLILVKGKVLDIIKMSPEAVERFAGKGFLEKLEDWNFYIYSQWFGKNFGQAVPIIGMIFSFPLISREVENGTIEFLLSRRKRSSVFLEKITASLIALMASVIFLSILPMLTSIWISLDLSKIPVLILHTTVGSFLWYSISLFFSSVFSDQVKPILSTLGTLAATTTLGFVSKFEFLNTYSYIMSASSMPARDVTYSVISAFFIFISWLVFKNRDF